MSHTALTRMLKRYSCLAGKERFLEDSYSHQNQKDTYPGTSTADSVVHVCTGDVCSRMSSVAVTRGLFRQQEKKEDALTCKHWVHAPGLCLLDGGGRAGALTPDRALSHRQARRTKYRVPHAVATAV